MCSIKLLRLGDDIACTNRDRAPADKSSVRPYRTFFHTHPDPFTTFQLNDIMSRTQLPLRLAWAFTILKISLEKIELSLGKRETSTGLTFVALQYLDEYTCEYRNWVVNI
jgi:hypothetical protein